MKLLIPCLLFTFVFVLTSAFVHKDRIEKPKTYSFVFLEGEPITLDNPNDSILTTYSNDIVNRKRKLVRAELKFNTGEALSFECEGDRWTTVKISHGNREFIIPSETIAKIPEIHFATVALLWDGLDERAFSASYFYIRFEIGTEKSFEKYPELNLMFSERRFSKPLIWRQISENSRQWANF